MTTKHQKRSKRNKKKVEKHSHDFFKFTYNMSYRDDRLKNLKDRKD